MGPDDSGASIRVEVAFSPRAAEVRRLSLTLPAGATVAQAIERCGFDVPAGLRVGVWGRLCTAEDTLRDRDRVEIYRPLRVDPKEARRQRYRKHCDAKA
jgi:hypothetical protein